MIEPREIKAVLISFVYFFFLMASYFILRPLRDTMGTVYGVAASAGAVHRHFRGELHRRADLCRAWPRASNWRRSCPGFTASSPSPWWFSILLFQRDANNRWIAAAFYVWLSTFNLLTISVFWSMMADIFSSTQAKRLFGFIAAGGTVGTISAPAFVTFFVKTRRHQHICC